MPSGGPDDFAIHCAWRLVVAFALGVPVWVVLLRDVVALANTLLHHANASWPEAVDARLRWILATPAMHRTHHSPDETLNNTNYGGLFSFWDRLFGTLGPADASARPLYGLRTLAAPKDQTVLGLLMTPGACDRRATIARAIRWPQVSSGALSRVRDCDAWILRTSSTVSASAAVLSGR